MDFNDIQNIWDDDKAENAVLPDNLEKIKAANTPLDKIKKNLKNELIYQIISIFLIGTLPFAYTFPPKAVVPFFLLFSLFTGICIYYLVKFFIFYKRLNNITLKTKDSLYETYFDIRLNMELYKTWGFALMPFMILFGFGGAYFLLPDVKIADINNTLLTAVVITIMISVLITALLIEWWVHYFYGKYAKEIRKVLDELKED